MDREITSVTLTNGFTDVAARPWLIIGQSQTSLCGPMRWPLPGVPCIVASMESCAVLAIAHLETMLERAVPSESQAWLLAEDDKASEAEGKLREEDLTMVVLKKGEGVMLPFGSMVQWVYSPDAPAITHGKLLVQWLLVEGVDAPSRALTEVKRSCQKLFATYGAANPWARVKPTVEAWLASLESGTS